MGFPYGQNWECRRRCWTQGKSVCRERAKVEQPSEQFCEEVGMGDEEYALDVDIRAYRNFVRDSDGYGLAQWDFWSRKQALLGFTKSGDKSIGDLCEQ